MFLSNIRGNVKGKLGEKGEFLSIPLKVFNFSSTPLTLPPRFVHLRPFRTTNQEQVSYKIHLILVTV